MTFDKNLPKETETMLPPENLVGVEGLLAMVKSDLSLLKKSELIDATPWSNAFSFDQIKILARYMDVYQVDRETVLFCEGDKNAYLILIVKGQIDVVKFDSERMPKRIATLGPGKTIGEMCIIDGEPRSAAAVTASETTLLILTAAHFHRLNSEFPGIGNRLVLKIAKQMSQCLRQTSGRLIDYLGT